MTYKYFAVAVPDSDSDFCRSFTYILERPGYPKLFSSWSTFVSYCNANAITVNQLDRLHYSIVEDATDSKYTSVSLADVQRMF